MQKLIELNKQQVPYTLKVSNRARRVRLSVRAGGDFVVTAPGYISTNIIERFILEKSHWVLEKIEQFTKIPISLLPKSTRKDFSIHKEKARTIVHAKVAHFNQFYNFKIGKIAIRNQQTRWGSCSKQGNLNFNYRIAHLPEALVDYIVVHELCHLQEFNHSKDFWNLVAETIPNHKELRKELKTNHL